MKLQKLRGYPPLINGVEMKRKIRIDGSTNHHIDCSVKPLGLQRIWLGHPISSAFESWGRNWRDSSSPGFVTTHH